MKLGRSLFFAFLLLVASSSWASGDEINFHPVNGTNVAVSVADSKVSYVIADEKGEVDKSIDIDTESKLHLSIGDYRFDGTKGFAVSYLDEGMGIYEISRVFYYSRKLRSFEELSPACGDEFLNLKVDSKKKVLISTYFTQNEPKTCVTRFGG
ncbi:hypothetical protein [Burkholderia sp. Ax-1719]|uniref:hypothetical protein n=1 Tax=Burkholderia sp. Ax-1719 TaxID=2608334 RepID=UPI0014239F01|nr:hypothetical protein [Burkholderia sp. Ax-1719]NIE66065.1 hypothetical protein [Burkholderia sp. Ax-1719]